MDYFKILNLNQEPFSNSPEPEFFFQSRSHLVCLQQLELAIRLRRGLNIVMGKVGTGKTTLCRQLILRLSESEDDRNEIETHLILDPSFKTPREFLSAVSATFGITGMESAESEWHIKEGIKNYLYQKGVDEKRNVVLIIDEGQELPNFCREILREFLNYETNKNKLLQIVIFAQTEFLEILKYHKNFADRVNQYYFLGPLNFRETRRMIYSRLARAGRPADGPGLFTLPALWLIYRVTGGYPRKIVTLCHQILLTVIIQNRIVANWLLVRAAARRLMPELIRRERWTTASLMVLLFLVVIAFFVFVPELLNLSWRHVPLWQRKADPIKAAAPIKPPPAKTSPVEYTVTALSQVNESGTAGFPKDAAKPAPAGKKREQVLPASGLKGQKVPDKLGHLRIREGGTVLQLLEDIYGSFRDVPFQEVIKANPHIKDMNVVSAGETINLPAIPVSSGFLGQGKVWVQLAKGSSLDDVYRFFKGYPPDMPRTRFIPTWNQRDGVVFFVFLKYGFPSGAEAQQAVRNLPPSLAAGATIIHDLEKDTVFFAN